MARTFLALACLAAVAQTQSTGARDDTAVVADFGNRVTKYLDLRKKTGGSQKAASEPTKLAESRKQIATRVLAARTDAKQGDIFTPEIATYFRRQIAATFAGPEGPKVRASLQHAEPVGNLAVKVNARYPQGLPLQSSPPTLLLNLPRLPKDLEYRIVGRDLVLLDTAPNLIVDFIPDAIPVSRDQS